MAQATATFETGVAGVGLSTSDAGSATAFDNVTAFGGNTITYDATHVANGTLACKPDATNNTASVAVFRWSTGIGTLTDWYGRVYLWADANPAGSYRFLADYNNDYPQLRITSAGKIQAVDAGASQAVITTASISLGQWVRIEWHLIHSATVGQWEVKLFNTATSTTADETQTSTANLNTRASLADVAFGLNSGGSSAGPIWLDNVVAGATSYPGPVVSAAAATPLTVTAFTGWLSRGA